MSACAGCGRGTTIGFEWACSNSSCGWKWCNNCAKGLVGRSCPRCGHACGSAAPSSGRLVGSDATQVARREATRITSALDQGFGGVNSRLGELADLQRQGLALSAQQTHELQSLREEQSRRFAEQRALEEQEAERRALFANAAAVIHESLLWLRAMERRVGTNRLDPIHAWLQLAIVEGRARWLDPASVDPTQRRDLVELRDLVERCREAIVASHHDGHDEVRRWMALIHERRLVEARAIAARNYVARSRAARGHPLESPYSASQAAAEIEALERHVAQARASRLVVDEEIAQFVKELRPAVLPLTRNAGMSAERAYERLLAIRADPRRLRWIRMQDAAAAASGAGVFGLGAAVLCAVHPVLAVGLAVPSAVLFVAGLAVFSARGEARGVAAMLVRALAAADAAIAVLEADLADLRWLRAELEHAEAWEHSEVGGGGIERLRQWRPDLEADVHTLLALSG